MRLDDCTPQEIVILTAILALSIELPGDFHKYAGALGELRRTYYKKPGRTRGHKTSGYVDGHQIRASKRYGS